MIDIIVLAALLAAIGSGGAWWWRGQRRRARLRAYAARRRAEDATAWHEWVARTAAKTAAGAGPAEAASLPRGRSPDSPPTLP